MRRVRAAAAAAGAMLAGCFAEPPMVGEEDTADASGPTTSPGTTNAASSGADGGDGDATEDIDDGGSQGEGDAGTTDDDDGGSSTGGNGGFCAGQSPTGLVLCDDFDASDALASGWVDSALDGGVVDVTARATVSSAPNGLGCGLTDVNGTATAAHGLLVDWAAPLEVQLSLRVDASCTTSVTRLVDVLYRVQGTTVYRLSVFQEPDDALRLQVNDPTAPTPTINIPLDLQLGEGTDASLRLAVEFPNVDVALDDRGPVGLVVGTTPLPMPERGTMELRLGPIENNGFGPCHLSYDDVLVRTSR